MGKLGEWPPEEYRLPSLAKLEALESNPAARQRELFASDESPAERRERLLKSISAHGGRVSSSC